MSETLTLIDQLLARNLMPETRADLEDFRKDAAAGTLDREDERYVRALYERLTGEGAGAAALADEPDVDTLEDEIATLKQQLAERDARIAELEAKLAAVNKT